MKIKELLFLAALAAISVTGTARAADAPTEEGRTAVSAPAEAAPVSKEKIPVIPFFQARMAPKNTAESVALWEAKVKAHPDDPNSFSGLAGAYLEKARETNDPTFYTRAEKELDKAQAMDADNYSAMSLRSQLHSYRHQFDQAIQWTEKAIQKNPNDPMNYGNLGDIYAELGQYDKAEDNYQKMADLRPGRAAYSRASYMKELYGEAREASALMGMAISAGIPKGEGTAWCHTYLGHMLYNNGYLPAAQKEYEAAIASFPGYFHAYAGMGNVKAAKGDIPGAIEMYQKALAGGPHHETLGALIELYTLTGQKEKAKEVRDQLSALQERYRQNSMDIDFEVAEIDAEQGVGLPNALKLAKEEVKTHGNVKAWDALAWIAYLNKDYALAQSAMKQATRIGTKNSLMDYHNARIQEALGDKEESLYLLNQALNRCPYFHVRYANDARQRVSRLTAELVSSSGTQTAQK
jgi:tetratricopeptide (TPR) repeat protein